MNSLRKTLILAFLIAFMGSAFAQKAKIDSLYKVLKTSKEDSNKVKILNDLSTLYSQVEDLDFATHFAHSSLKLAQKLNYKKGMAISYNKIGSIYFKRGNYLKALKNYSLSLEIRKKIGGEHEKAILYGNIGNIYYNQGNYPESLKNYLISLKISNQIGFKKQIGKLYNNIGLIYYSQGNYPEALKNYFASLKILEKIGNKRVIAYLYGNIGIVCESQGNYPEALKNYFASLKILQEIGNKRGVAITYNNIGNVYQVQNKYIEALKSYLLVIKIEKELGNNDLIANTYNNVGNLKLKQGKPKIAKIWFQKSLILAKKIGSKAVISVDFQSISTTDSTLGNYKSAYENYKMYIIYRDSLKNKEDTKKITQMQMQFKFNQQQAADSITHAKEKEIQQAKIAKQNAVIKAKQEQQYALFGGLALLLIFAGFMYNRFRVTSKQKKIIEKQKAETENQKQLVEIKNKEISDSITYAKRIQEAILPSRFSLAEGLKNGFVLFKPKDIVSGDFYWLEKVDEAIYFAAADCTGHGVPGAMVSVVCANALSKALLEENITETGKLLDRTREIVIQQFSHSDENVKDGMDISLCKLTPSENGGGLLQWSGANNPLWIINPSRKEWFKESVPFGEGMGGAEVKADKQPIGKTDNPKPFTTHNIELVKGDSIYIFSDGYADQFGGKDGKKFKYKPLKELLILHQNKTMEEQKQAIENAFNEWRGKEEQIDDVCIIGIKV